MSRSTLAPSSFASLRSRVGLAPVATYLERERHTLKCIVCKHLSPDTRPATVLFSVVNGPTGSLEGPVCREGHGHDSEPFRLDAEGVPVSYVSGVVFQATQTVQASTPALSESQGLILRVIQNQWTREGVTTQTLANVTGLGADSIRRQCRKLVGLGLVSVSKLGRSNLYTKVS